MSNTPHTLGEEFPQQIEKLHALKASDPRFAQLLDDYDAINDKVHRAETRVDSVDELAEVELRSQPGVIRNATARAPAEA
ncbi:YdcH family protein [Paenirhodobacter enshiensis]|uniref:YdcH family protein n=1 Tax=Paenirhodobacter enshiensis TaxID=1105367 RepID=UPI003FA1F8DC